MRPERPPRRSDGRPLDDQPGSEEDAFMMEAWVEFPMPGGGSVVVSHLSDEPLPMDVPEIPQDDGPMLEPWVEFPRPPAIASSGGRVVPPSLPDIPTIPQDDCGEEVES